jgi:glycyl-tRNA synthetase beta chain
MPTSKVLPGLLAQLVTPLRAPKTMRWDASGVRFARPIRWLLAVYGTTPIRCTVGRLISADKTWVGQPLHRRAVQVRSAERYFEALKRAGILWDHRARRARIEQMVAQLAKRASGKASPEMVSHGLLDEVTHLAEQPVALTGAFDRTYLALPREVLLASMAKYQRVFAVESSGGKLLPTFIAILDGSPKRPAEVRKVIEHILNARLADSLMFWEQDRKRSLQQMAQSLSDVTFHEKLGSMQDKAFRLHKLASMLEDAWSLTTDELAHLRRACELAKADLVSTMVKEFPTLQGVVGKHYARASGEPESVALAIEEQYLPTGERLPATVIGAALAILDKYDTLAGYFSVGIEPTGDQDPFGLRRAAQGIVEIAWKVHRPLRLDLLFGTWQTLAPWAQGKVAVAKRVQDYVLDRLYTFVWPSPTPGDDLIDAVLAGPRDNLVDVMDRIRSLQQLNSHPDLLKAAKVIERTRNILKGAKARPTDVDPAQFKESLEHRLWDVYQSHRERLTRLATDKEYAKATTAFGEAFYAPLHEFFDKVMVNDPEPTLQQNRLALMRAINTLYTERIADLSKLTILQREESA